MLQTDKGIRRRIKWMPIASFSGDGITTDQIDVIDAHKRVAIRHVFECSLLFDECSFQIAIASLRDFIVVGGGSAGMVFRIIFVFFVFRIISYYRKYINIYLLRKRIFCYREYHFVISTNYLSRCFEIRLRTFESKIFVTLYSIKIS